MLLTELYNLLLTQFQQINLKMKMKKYKILLFLLLLVSGQFYGQRTVTVVGDKLKIKNLVQKNNATRTVVQDSITKEFFFVPRDTTNTGGGGVHDILQFATASAMPVTGEVGKIYYTIDTDYYYVWNSPI